MRNQPLLNWNGVLRFPVLLHTDQVHTTACRLYSFLYSLFTNLAEIFNRPFGIKFLIVTQFVAKNAYLPSYDRITQDSNQLLRIFLALLQDLLGFYLSFLKPN